MELRERNDTVMFTASMKAEFLAIQTNEDYKRFLSKYHVTVSDIGKDPEIAKKMSELVWMAPGSRQEIPGVHVDLKRKK